MTFLTSIPNGGSYGDIRQTLNAVLKRTVDSRLFGVVADSTGATGNGTDNKAALDATIAFAKAQGGGTIMLPAGYIRTTATAHTIDASNIGVDGIGSKLFFDTTSANQYGKLLFDGSAASGGRIYNNCVRNVEVYQTPGTDVPDIGSGSTAEYPGQGSMITFRNCGRFVVDACDVHDTAQFAIAVLNCIDGSVVNNHCHDTRADCIHVQDGCKRISIVGNNLHDCGDDAIGIGFYGRKNDSIVIASNAIYNAGARGIVVFLPTGNVTVTGNTIGVTWLAGIRIEAGGGSNTGGDTGVGNVAITGNVLDGYGTMALTGFARGGGWATGISLDTAGGTLNNLTVTGNIFANGWNGYIWIGDGQASGTLNRVIVAGNVCSGLVGYGARGTSSSGGGGVSVARNFYPGILVRYATTAHVVDNIIETTAEDGILAPDNVGLIRCSGNTFGGMNTSSGSAKYALNLAGATTVFASGNIAKDVTRLAGFKNLPTGATDLNNISLGGASSGAATVIAADNFNRASATAASGALGNTSTGAKLWVGNGGITANQAYFAGGYDHVALDTGVADMDVSIDVTLGGSGECYLFARTNASCKPAVFLNPAGALGLDTGSGSPQVLASFTGFTSGTHHLRLAIIGNNVYADIDGVRVATATSSSLPTTTYAGFQEGGSGNTTRFDNFSVGAAS